MIGPSGAGESTLLRTLAGLAVAPHGTVVFVGVAASGLSSSVGFVAQDDMLHHELPLRRTLRYADVLRLAGPADAVGAAVADAMHTLGLEQHGDVPVDSLSGGQRERASIA